MSSSSARPLASLLLLLPALVPAGAAEADDRGLIRGEVLRARNRPLVGAVALAVRDGGPPMIAVTTTDEWGFFRLKGLPEGTYWTAVLRKGYEPSVNRDVRVQGPFPSVLDHVGRPTEGEWSAPVVLDGEARGEATIDLRVSDKDGVPVADARLSLLRLDAIGDPLGARTGLEGRIEMTVPAGQYRIRLFCVGKLPIEVPSVTVPGVPVAVRALLLDQPINYRPAPTEVLPVEWALPPPGAIVATTIEEVLAAETPAAPVWPPDTLPAGDGTLDEAPADVSGDASPDGAPSGVPDSPPTGETPGEAPAEKVPEEVPAEGVPPAGE